MQINICELAVSGHSVEYQTVNKRSEGELKESCKCANIDSTVVWRFDCI